MEETYGLQAELNPDEDLHGLIASARDRRTTMTSDFSEEEELKARFVSHPRYPILLQAYIDCQKVGAPPGIACHLDEVSSTNGAVVNKRTTAAGSDPELDDFMERYCDVLVKYGSDLARPLGEATAFLNTIETQLSEFCSNKLLPAPSSSRRSSPFISVLDEAAGSSDEEVSGGETEVQEFHLKGESRDLKERLLRRYSGYLSSLKQEFSKKKKKGKLPKEGRQMLLEWWTAHYKWPYPTEADKIALAESTGLYQKQINNWFINQRKRHWKPSESMQFAVLGNLSAPLYDD